MKPAFRKLALLILVLALLAGAYQWAQAAQQAVTASILQYAVTNGGGVSNGGSFALTGSIGQPAAGPVTGGVAQLTGGIIHPSGVYRVYLPITKKR